MLRETTLFKNFIISEKTMLSTLIKISRTWEIKLHSLQTSLATNFTTSGKRVRKARNLKKKSDVFYLSYLAILLEQNIFLKKNTC